MNRKQLIMTRVNEHYAKVAELGYEVVGVYLVGSQNYNLDYEDSDIDTKAIVLPTFEDIVLMREPKSYTHIMENQEHIDIKDVRVMFGNFKKQNINFMEILFTDFKRENPKYCQIMQQVFDAKEDIAHYDIKKAVNCMVGMAYEKYKALEHPYPTIINKIEKYGYDGKQLHHILRSYEFFQKYVSGANYKDCLEVNDPTFLIDVKKNVLPLEEARKLAKETLDNFEKEKNLFLENFTVDVNEKCVDVLNLAVTQLLKKYFQDVILSEKFDFYAENIYN